MLTPTGDASCIYVSAFLELVYIKTKFTFFVQYPCFTL